MKVWHTSDGRSERVIAATSKRAAAEAMGYSLYAFNQYASETGNAEDIAQAMSEPGVVFHRSNNYPRGEWQRAEYGRFVS